MNDLTNDKVEIRQMDLHKAQTAVSFEVWIRETVEKLWGVYREKDVYYHRSRMEEDFRDCLTNFLNIEELDLILDDFFYSNILYGLTKLDLRFFEDHAELRVLTYPIEEEDVIELGSYSFPFFQNLDHGKVVNEQIILKY